MDAQSMDYFVRELERKLLEADCLKNILYYNTNRRSCVLPNRDSTRTPREVCDSRGVCHMVRRSAGLRASLIRPLADIMCVYTCSDGDLKNYQGKSTPSAAGIQDKAVAAVFQYNQNLYFTQCWTLLIFPPSSTAEEDVSSVVTVRL